MQTVRGVKKLPLLDIILGLTLWTLNYCVTAEQWSIATVPLPLPPSLCDRGSACRLSSRAPVAPPSRPIPFLHDIICTSVVPTGCWGQRQATKLVDLSHTAFVSHLFLSVCCTWSFSPFLSVLLNFHLSIWVFSYLSFCPTLSLLHYVLQIIWLHAAFSTMWQEPTSRQETAIKLNDPCVDPSCDPCDCEQTQSVRSALTWRDTHTSY